LWFVRFSNLWLGLFCTTAAPATACPIHPQTPPGQEPAQPHHAIESLKSEQRLETVSQIETIPNDNLDDVRRQTLATLAVASFSYWHLGQNLYRFREALDWGLLVLDIG
jgi:hypothetical protein